MYYAYLFVYYTELEAHLARAWNRASALDHIIHGLCSRSELANALASHIHTDLHASCRIEVHLQGHERHDLYTMEGETAH